MKTKLVRFLVPALMALTIVPWASSETLPTRMNQVPSEDGKPSYVVHTAPQDPLGPGAPVLGNTDDALSAPITALRSGSKALRSGPMSASLSSTSPVIGTDTWIKPGNFNDELTIAMKADQTGKKQIVVGGWQAFYYYYPTNSPTWQKSSLPDAPGYTGVSDISVMTAPNGNRPRTFYAVSMLMSGSDLLGILVRQSDDGGATWPTASPTNTSKSLFIPAAGADFPQAVVDNDDNIWIYWMNIASYGGDGLHHWTKITHDANFNLSTSYTIRNAPAQYEAARLFHDPVRNRVYAVGSEWIFGTNNCNIFVTRLEDGKAFTAPYLTIVKSNTIYYYWRTVPSYKTYLPGMRLNGSVQYPSGGASNQTLYVAWYEPANNTVLGYPVRLKLRRIFDDLSGPGTGLTQDVSWTFDGTDPVDPDSWVWNCPYRIDVTVNRQQTSPGVYANTIGIVFFGGYIHPSTQTLTHVSRRILTNTADGLVPWYDSRLSQSNPYWAWVDTWHTEFYRSFVDPSTNKIYAVWTQDGVYGSTTGPYNNQTFYNSIQP